MPELPDVEGWKRVRMSGSLTWTAEPDGLHDHDHDRVAFELDDGRLTYRSQRRLGGVWSAGDSDEIDAITGTLGPDAADVDHDGWLESVRGAEDPRCPRCGAKIERVDAAGRTAYVCPREQRS